MIKSLRIENFKCFEDQSFNFGNLTLLTGLNGTGKSSVIQSLLLLRQSYQHRFLENKTLLLNSDLIQLGTVRDALYIARKNDRLGFCLEFSDKIRAEWHFEPREEKSEDISHQISGGVPKEVYDTSLFGNNFHYLAADRIGPQSAFEISDYTVDDLGQLGDKGEYTAHFLKVFGDAKSLTDDTRAHNDSMGANLIYQVDAWMGEISPGIRVNLESYYRDIDRINLRYVYNMQGVGSTTPFRSTNVGFGVTYTLPIVVALLAAEEDTLVLLENPESHLHPKGQFKLGELMVRAASCGVQVIVESHSDHILNGMRVAVREGIIAPDKVSLYYLSRPENTNQFSSKVDSPRIDKDGSIDEWPEGFFDEFEKSLVQLF